LFRQLLLETERKQKPLPKLTASHKCWILIRARLSYSRLSTQLIISTAILDDPNIDAVFIPLANSFHYEWAVKSIRAGKHVLLEKPSCSNSVEADILFNLPELSRPNAPVLLEAFHSRFYPSWQYFKSLVNSDDVEHVESVSAIP
jgi:hypothetical protein